jgi:hypothetical protein
MKNLLLILAACLAIGLCAGDAMAGCGHHGGGGPGC